MSTNYPTTTICFRLGHRLFKIQVFTTEEALIRKMIRLVGNAELIEDDRHKECSTTSARVLADMVRQALPGLFRHLSPQRRRVKAKLKQEYRLGESL